jgi:hypothetical protein
MHVGTNSHTKFNRRRNSNTSNKNEHFLKKRWISGFLGLAGIYSGIEDALSLGLRLQVHIR